MAVLKTWMVGQKLRLSDLVKRLGFSKSKVARLLSGERHASFETAQAILDLTNGAVTPNDLHEQHRAWLISRGEYAGPPDAAPDAAPACPPVPAPWMEAAE